jgi:hypothetical protein
MINDDDDEFMYMILFIYGDIQFFFILQHELLCFYGFWFEENTGITGDIPVLNIQRNWG